MKYGLLEEALALSPWPFWLKSIRIYLAASKSCIRLDIMKTDGRPTMAAATCEPAATTRMQAFRLTACSAAQSATDMLASAVKPVQSHVPAATAVGRMRPTNRAARQPQKQITTECAPIVGGVQAVR